MSSSFATGLLKGLGQGAAIVGQKALDNHYEQLRMAKRQQYSMDTMNAQHEKSLERDAINHERAEGLLKTRHQNSIDAAKTADELSQNRQDKQNQWELDNRNERIDLWLDEDGNLSETGEGVPAFQRGSDGTLYDMRPKVSKSATEASQKNRLAFIKRKQELEDKYSEGLLDDQKFDQLMAQARKDYGVNSSSSNLAPQPEQILKAFMDSNKGVTRQEAEKVLSTKYPELFASTPSPSENKPKGLLNPSSIEARKLKAEEIRKRKEEENRAAILKAQKDYRDKMRYEQEAKNQLSLIEQYRLRTQEND